MKNGYKIVDVDSHMMEPDWLWERHIEDRYKSPAPKMGIAPASGRRTFLVEGEPFTREKGKYPMAAPAFFKTVAEANRAAKLGAVSFYVRPNPVDGSSIFDDYYLPLWTEVERLGLPISTHDSASSSVPSFGDRMNTHVSGHILSHPFEAMAAMAGLIWYGIFEKFPKLKVIHVEADGGWVPYWLQRMEQHWDFSGNAEHEYLTLRPTEYFKRNVCVAFRGDEPTLKAAVDLVGDNNFSWDTDYPHPDGTYPWGVEAILKQPIASEARRKILWDNAARMFNLS